MLLVSCGIRADSLSDESSHDGLPTTTEPPDGAVIDLVVTSSVPPGDAYSLALSLENTGSSSIEFLYSGQEYEFWIERSGVLVWRWSDAVEAEGSTFQEFLGFRSLQPGEARVATETWDAPSAAGTYQVHGAWRTLTEANMTQTVHWWGSPPMEIVIE
jgi:hypothetical protein